MREKYSIRSLAREAFCGEAVFLRLSITRSRKNGGFLWRAVLKRLFGGVFYPCQRVKNLLEYQCFSLVNNPERETQEISNKDFLLCKEI